jgi:hypothetical protein
MGLFLKETVPAKVVGWTHVHTGPTWPDENPDKQKHHIESMPKHTGTCCQGSVLSQIRTRFT